MRKSVAIGIDKFRAAYEKVGWRETRTKDGKYIVWVSPSDHNLWIQLPVTENAIDYAYYAERNVLMLLYALDMPETKQSIDEMISQLRAYNYKLINRIVGKSDFRSDAVPYELATLLPQKNIEAFRHFYLTTKTSKRSIPIEKFELNHTEVGSFVIPVSILVEEDDNTTIVPLRSETNRVLHDYLKMVDTLVKIKSDDAVSYAEQVVGHSIDSSIVKDFLGRTSSIAKAREKYDSLVEGVTISSSGSPLLDFKLEEKDKEFEVVQLSTAGVLDDEYIKEIERLEIKIDENRVEEYQARIDVVVDNIDRGGNIKVTVIAINGTKIKKPFKAWSNELSKSRLDLFAEYFKNEGAAVVKGDISKATGKMGKIVIDTVGPETEDVNTKLFKI